MIPLPNLAGISENYFNAASQRMVRDNYDLKINWNRNSSHQIWGKYSRMDAVVSGFPGLGPAGGPRSAEPPAPGIRWCRLYTLGINVDA
ncbi:MAG: hypothetical protein WKF84_08650 [Pyrinomonadaceae bacterium]